MNIIIRIKGEETTWDELANLLHESFQERLMQGLHFSCSYLTAGQLERMSAKDIVLLAIDNDNNELAGTVSLNVSSKRNGSMWAYHYNLAIKPTYKNCGIASKLFERFQEIAQLKGCTHIISDTAVGATSSVKWHLKNGFKKIGLRSFQSTNYYSVLFRKQLNDHWLWSNATSCYIFYVISSMLYHLYKNENGSLTMLGELLYKIRMKCKN